ncbi:MAG TPA: hypothetical protein DEP35_22930 [Deltaproteobacteria bacterium]|jgi:hypothetical protein|nr:hypothetical protein [Deltaproteobacteria bacterium]
MQRSLRLQKVPFVLALSAVLACSGCALLVAGAAAGGAAGGVSAARAGDTETHTAMSYVGSVLASTVYFPAKVVFASAGAVTSGLAYLVTAGNPQSASSIWNAAVEGDYVVTPDVIDGTRPLHFVGS